MMAQGPLGAPRPFVEPNCNIVIYQRGLGRPREEPERRAVELDAEIAANVPYIPANGSTVFVNLPREARSSNTIEVAAGIDKTKRMNIETIQDIYNSIESKIINVGGAERVDIGYITSGDPQEVIK